MKIIIDIPEKQYEYLSKIADAEQNLLGYFERVIMRGTPLPKGHGRLIDADALNRKDVNCANVPMNFIDVAPTIIEADNVRSEE